MPDQNERPVIPTWLPVLAGSFILSVWLLAALGVLTGVVALDTGAKQTVWTTLTGFVWFLFGVGLKTQAG